MHNHNDPKDQQHIIDALPAEEITDTVAQALKQLGDPTRLRIFWLLCHTEECVTDIAEIIGMTSPAVSHHLRILKQAHLISSRREGKEMFYRAADSPLVDMLHKSIETIGEITCPRC
ncbi:MAG: metalloregulator ArsR/SmtB family transcription factor [Lachnospiraceae bacterium]|nr:metalloregulator ArsR/SmtB family transcription factor [Lachnospiraceae bacterium]